jgi:hypothetical protein
MERRSQRLRVYPRHDAELARVLPTLRDQRDDIVRERAEDIGRVRAEDVDVAASMSVGDAGNVGTNSLTSLRLEDRCPA